MSELVVKSAIFQESSTNNLIISNPKLEKANVPIEVEDEDLELVKEVRSRYFEEASEGDIFLLAYEEAMRLIETSDTSYTVMPENLKVGKLKTLVNPIASIFPAPNNEDLAPIPEPPW